MISVTATPDPAKGASHALIRVAGGARASSHGFRISRSPEWPGFNLGAAGWQGSEETLQPDASRLEGDDLVLCIGPSVCNVLEPDNYFFAMAGLGEETSISWPDIAPLHAGSTTIFLQPAAPDRAVISVLPVMEKTVAPPPPRPVEVPSKVGPPKVEQPPPIVPVGLPTSPVATPAESPPRLPLVLGLLMAAILLGGATAWWVWFRPVTTEQFEVPPPPPILDFDTMPVQGLVATNDPAKMLDQAQKRLAARPQDALLLLEAAGEDRHNGQALTLLAQLYDPNKPRRGGIPADPRQAAKYYREAVRNNDHTGTADREALHRILVQKRDAGDLTAKLIEQDFWP